MSDIFSEYQKLKKELHRKPPTVFDRYEKLQRELTEKRQQREHEALDRLENLMESLVQVPEPPVEVLKEQPVVVSEEVESLIEVPDFEPPKVEVEARVPDLLPRQTQPLKEAVYDDSRLIRRIENLERRLADIIMSSTNGTDSGGDNNLVKPATVITDYTSLGYSSKDVILCDTENNDITVTLPDTAKNHGWKVHVKKMHRNHQLYIRGYNSSQLIDEKELITINTVYTNLIMVTDGSHWYIV